jgi:hypothetical protein
MLQLSGLLGGHDASTSSTAAQGIESLLLTPTLA